MIQPYDFPEHLMSADPDFFIEKKLAKTEQGLSFFDPRALCRNTSAICAIPATVHAMCEDYRATETIDFAMDTKDFDAGRKIACPVLLLWGATGGSAAITSLVRAKSWQRYATDIRGAKALPCGHYLVGGSAGGNLQGAQRVLYSGRTGNARIADVHRYLPQSG